MILVPEKALMIILFLYCISFSALGAQWVIGDVLGIQLTSPVTGQPIKAALISGSSPIINQDKITSFENSLNTTKKFDPITASIAAADIGWNIFLLATGFYIFNILYLFGVPLIFIVPMLFIYIVLLARAVLALIRGY